MHRKSLHSHTPSPCGRAKGAFRVVHGAPSPAPQMEPCGLNGFERGSGPQGPPPPAPLKGPLGLWGATLRHTEFRYPQPPTVLDEISVPRQQLYQAARSPEQNRRAFKAFLGALQRLHCDHHSHTTVFLAHDAKTCFMCDQTTEVMHHIFHHKNGGRYLRFGPPPPADIADVHAMNGLYLQVDTSSQYNDGLLMCSECHDKQTSLECMDFYSPKVRTADCRAAESIMFRNWKHIRSWECCSTIYTPQRSMLQPVTPH